VILFSTWDKIRYEVLPKLRREWKTALVAVLGTIIEVHDALIATGLIDLNPFIPPQYRPYVSAAWPILMLVLRKWRDHVVIVAVPATPTRVA
jgi:hypothetical protein